MTAEEPGVWLALGGDKTTTNIVGSMWEEGVRVRVSLVRWYSDARANVYMSAAPHRSARWLLRRIARAFPALPAPSALALRSRGHLLPSTERLHLLRHDDPLEVIPAPELTHAAASPSVAGERVPPADTPHSTEAPPLAEAPHDGGGDGGALIEMKRRALQMLERFEEEEEAPLPRRRRRVRRRRRAEPPAEGAECPSRDSSVMRDSSPRPPRIVYALPAVP